MVAMQMKGIKEIMMMRRRPPCGSPCGHWKIACRRAPPQ